MARKGKYGPSTHEVIVTSCKTMFGEYGKEILSFEDGNATSTPETLFRQLQVIEDAEILGISDDEAIVAMEVPGEGEEVVIENVDQSSYLIGKTIKAGTTLFGLFHDIEIGLGVVVCYRESPSKAGLSFSGMK